MGMPPYGVCPADKPGHDARVNGAQQWDHKGPDGWFVGLRNSMAVTSRSPSASALHETLTRNQVPVWLPEIKKGLRADARNPI